MRRFLFFIVFGLAGLSILIGLGSWQLRRLAWKEGILAEIEARIAADPVALPSHPQEANDRYLAVAASGVVLPGEVHVLVSVKRVGPGYRVIAPFLTDAGVVVLLDRGFVPSDKKNEQRGTGPMTVNGNLQWPRETDSYTPVPDIGGNTWFARDVPAMAAELGTQPILIVARSQTDPTVTPMPVDTVSIPNDHLNYAITWFSLALIWAAMTAYFLWRTRAKTTS